MLQVHEQNFCTMHLITYLDSCTNSPMTRFSSRPGVYKAWSAWKNMVLFIDSLSLLKDEKSKTKTKVPNLVVFNDSLSL